MKKVGIITINDNNNYGNRLQNYATQEFLKKNNIENVTIKNKPELNFKNKFIIGWTKDKLKILKNLLKKKNGRNKCFKDFNKNITFSNFYVNPYMNLNSDYDAFVVGSDQVWNYNFKRLSDVDLLCFAENDKKIAFSASFGISKLNDEYKDRTKKALETFKSISVREDTGKEIVTDLTNRNDVEVLIDPTMLLTSEEWDKVSKVPKQLSNLKNKKYILNYFLGEISEERKLEIERVANENDCEIINLLDKQSSFYETGPSEFLYLEKNAFLICTDSFHSSVFAVIYNRPFIIFEREDNKVNMNSRIETLISKLKLTNRKFKDKITEENLNHNYEKAYEILNIEREKSKSFIYKALDIKEK